MLKINEIFWSLQMEGQFAGFPAIFIRLAECNLKCQFCDTDFSVKMKLKEESILREINKYACDRVVITGGEPLLQNLSKLVRYLQTETYKVHIETNGTVDFPFPYVRRFDWITLSPKGKLKDIKLHTWDEVKIIVSTEMSEDEIVDRINTLRRIRETPIYLQPCCQDGILSKKTQDNTNYAIELVQHHNLRLSMQGHKYINIR